MFIATQMGLEALVASESLREQSRGMELVIPRSAANWPLSRS